MWQLTDVHPAAEFSSDLVLMLDSVYHPCLNMWPHSFDANYTVKPGPERTGVSLTKVCPSHGTRAIHTETTSKQESEGTATGACQCTQTQDRELLVPEVNEGDPCAAVSSLTHTLLLSGMGKQHY